MYVVIGVAKDAPKDKLKIQRSIADVRLRKVKVARKNKNKSNIKLP